MTYDEMKEIVLDLSFDTMTEVYNNGEQAILIYRPSTLSERFKNYDVNTNFQIFLRIGDNKPFRPNHLRLLIDLKLRARELSQSKEELLIAFDKIFYGANPLDAIKPLTHIPFTQYINPIDITAILAQLFISSFSASAHCLHSVLPFPSLTNPLVASAALKLVFVSNPLLQPDTQGIKFRCKCGVSSSR